MPENKQKNLSTVKTSYTATDSFTAFYTGNLLAPSISGVTLKQKT